MMHYGVKHHHLGIIIWLYVDVIAADAYQSEGYDLQLLIDIPGFALGFPQDTDNRNDAAT